MKNRKIAVLSLMAAATACVVTAATAMNTKLAYAAGEDTFHELGASVRVADDKGIRFAFGLPEGKTGDGYEIGTLVFPKAKLGDAELTHNADVDYQDIPCTKNWVPNENLLEAKDGYKYYNAALTGIEALNYNTVLVARSYYVKDGVYTYSDPVERSIGYVASAALNDGYEDTKGILTDIVTTGFGEEALTVEGESFVTMDTAITLEARNEKKYLPVWSTSDANVATVDKTGKVTVEKGGEVTISATIGNKTASKTVYAMGKGLYADNIGMRVNGYNMTNSTTYMTMNIGENGEMVIGANFQASWENYYAGLVWNNIQSKDYYQALVDNGYGYLMFDLKVEGDDKDKVDDLYVFCGQKLTSMEKVGDVYKVKMLVSDIVRVYDRVQTFVPSDDRKGQTGSAAGMLLAWRDNRGSDKGQERNYIFTISNAEYIIPTIEMDFAENSADLIEIGETTKLVATTNGNAHDVVWTSSNEAVAMVEDGLVTGLKGGQVTITATVAGVSVSKTVYVVGAGLYSNQIGIRIDGNEVSGNSNYFQMKTGENGEMIITANNFEANSTYNPGLLLNKNKFSKAYYEKLQAEGYKKFTFSLVVGGDNATDVSDLYVFGKAVTSFGKNANGEYQVVIDISNIITYYATINDLATYTTPAGQSGSFNAKFIAWKSPAGDNDTVRNYVFTISNTRFAKGVLFADDFGFRDGGEDKTYNGMVIDTGANGEIIIDATFHAADTYGTFLMFNNMNTITYLAGLKGKYASFTFELTVEGGAVNDLHTFGTAKAISTCNKVSGKDNTYVVEIRLDIQYFTDTNWKNTITSYADHTTTTKKGQWDSRSQMLLAWRYNGGSGFKNSANHAAREYRFTIANFELRESLLYKY